MKKHVLKFFAVIVIELNMVWNQKYTLVLNIL